MEVSLIEETRFSVSIFLLKVCKETTAQGMKYAQNYY